MRIAPVGIAVPCDPIEHLVDVVVETSRVTHNTSIGLAAASAVAAAVSTGVEGGDKDACLEAAVRAADLGAQRGNWTAGAHVGTKARWAIGRLKSLAPARWADEIDFVIGTDVIAQESVVAALTIASVAPSAWEGVCLAASVGGDTDTIAAIVGATMGAQGGISAWPPEAIRLVQVVNDLDVSPFVGQLLALRLRADV